MTAALVACGIDPKRSVLFNQAQVPAHAELQWLLSGTARMGWLNRMTQWKDKAGKNREGQSVALFTYPVLQAADVLLYQATHVPVGEDQKQHLELARDIAQKFNNDFAREDAPVFTLPEPIVPPDAARIMSLRDGTAKMSKSDPSEMSRINLSDDADEIMRKVRKAKTDPEPLPSEAAGLEGRPEALNLVAIYARPRRQDGRCRVGRARRARLRRVQARARRADGRGARADRRALQRAAPRPRIARRDPRARAPARRETWAHRRFRRHTARSGWCAVSGIVDSGRRRVLPQITINKAFSTIAIFNRGSARHSYDTACR